jgi:two-component system sensor histidine kinase TctE
MPSRSMSPASAASSPAAGSRSARSAESAIDWTKSNRAARPRTTLRRRLLLALSLPLLIILGLSLGIVFETASDTSQTAFDHALGDDAIALASRATIHDGKLTFNLPEAAQELLRTDSEDLEFFSVFGPDGRLVAGDADLVPEAVPAGEPPLLTDGRLRGHAIRKASYRIQTAAGPVTTAFGETQNKAAQARSHILAALLIPNLLLLGASLLIVYVGVRAGLAPLNHLSEVIAARAPDDLSPLPAGEVPGEAEPLIDAIQNLIADLRAASAAQRRFLADAAHQLRTPLAGMETQLDLAAGELPPEYRGRLARVRDAAHRLVHLTQQLLALARSAPEASLGHDLQVIDLAAMIEDSASRWYDLASAKELDLGFETAPAPVLGSRWLLDELLGNLLDNAIRYTEPGGRVTVRTGTEPGGGGWLEVEDTGPGIPAAERSRIFERFYRAEGVSQPGTGLGLSIVKEVAARHSAAVEVLEGPEGIGTRFRVTFPLVPLGAHETSPRPVNLAG